MTQTQAGANGMGTDKSGSSVELDGSQDPIIPRDRLRYDGFGLTTIYHYYHPTRLFKCSDTAHYIFIFARAVASHEHRQKSFTLIRSSFVSLLQRSLASLALPRLSHLTA